MARDEPLTPELAVRLLRAKAAEMEAWVQIHLPIAPTEPYEPIVLWLTADVALLATLLADEIERRE